MIEKFNFSDANNKWYKYAFWIATVLIFFFMVNSSDRYGITWDEADHKKCGEVSLKYYTSFGKDTSFIDRKHPMHLYGGFVEITAAMLTNGYDGDPYDRRHLYLSLFGFIGVLFSGLLARQISGWRAGCLGLLFLFFSPVFIGNSFFNSKDAPSASMTIVALFFIIRFVIDFPRIRWVNVIGVIVSIGIAMSIRVGGMLLIGYLGLFIISKILYDLYLQPKSTGEFISVYFRSLVFTLLVAIASFFAGVIVWPYAFISPLKHPFEALTVMSGYVFDSNGLFDGKWVHMEDTPWYYIPKWIWVNSPLFVNLGLFLIPFFLLSSVAKKVALNNRILALICFTFAFPVFYIIYNKSNVYDGWRHLLFIYPSLIVACALVWDKLIEIVKVHQVKVAVATGIVLIILEPALWMLNNHPYEAFYFSPVVGGTKGAFKKYEIDYYGTSYRNAVEWIAANSDTLQKGPSGKTRVWAYYGERESSEHFIKKYPSLENVIVNEESADWDYSIVLPVQAKHNHNLLLNWPPKGMIHQIEVDGAPLVAIVRNHRTAIKNDLNSFSIYTCTDPNMLISQSVKYFQVGDFFNCFAACERSLQLAPSNIGAYNNIASSFNNLYLFDEAIEYSEKALKIDPNFEMAKANYAAAQERKKQMENISKQGVASNYLNASVIYFNLGEHAQCIAFSKKAISLSPNIPAAYNNIGASYNVLGDYAKAVEAFKQALQLDPNFQLAKNNLAVAQKALGGN